MTRLGDGVAVLLTRLQAVDRADLGAGIGPGSRLPLRLWRPCRSRRDRSALLVLDHWQAIGAVGRALRGSRRGIVSRDRVAEIVARTPRRRGLTLA